MDIIGKNKIFLLVEDDLSLQEAIKLKLEKMGVNIITADNGEEAFYLIKEKGLRPSLIWLDLLMPKMGGLEFLKKVREDETLHSLPIVVVSASGSSDKIEQAHNLGVLDYIVKGQDALNILVERVKNYL